MHCEILIAIHVIALLNTTNQILWTNDKNVKSEHMILI